MASPVVVALYRTLLRSTQTLQRDVEAGRTLYDAVRSGAVASYADIKTDWIRERVFVRRFEKMNVVKRRGKSDWIFAVITRAGFAAPVESNAVLDARIDAAFKALKGVDDQNALIKKFQDQGVYSPKVRTNAIKFLIGDVVEVQGETRGVIFAWHVGANTEETAAGSCVAYDILPHSPGLSFASKLHNVPQDEIRLDESPKAVDHPALLLYFDSFDGTHHVPSKALAARYPSDVAPNAKDADAFVALPSILQLQCADEKKLLAYLRCNDSTIVQFATASLEGIWAGEGGRNAQEEVQRALTLAHQTKWDEGRHVLEQIVQDFPTFAYAWTKLAMVEYRSGKFVQALDHYETAVKLTPHLVEALVGLGTCALRLRRWPVVHRAAIQVLDVQPSNEMARVLLEQAIFATL